MDKSLGRRFLLTSVKYGIPTYLSLPSLKVSCPNRTPPPSPPQMRNTRKQLKKVDLWGWYHIFTYGFGYANQPAFSASPFGSLGMLTRWWNWLRKSPN